MGRCVDTVAVKVVYSPFMTYSSGNRESTPSAACARHPAAHRGLSSLMATAAATAGERTDSPAAVRGRLTRVVCARAQTCRAGLAQPFVAMVRASLLRLARVSRQSVASYVYGAQSLRHL